MAKMNFAGTVEEVITRDEFPMEKAREVLKDEVIAVLGYGVQGPAQALNMRDNGFKVIVGQREGTANWNKAIKDGWVSDAAQKLAWRQIKPHLKKGDALYFSHGFSIVYNEQTTVIPPTFVDVIMVAPKGSGTSVRANFLNQSGINSSFAVEQDYTGRARERTLALGIAVGSGYLFETSFEHEVFSDLTGERGVLMGALAGIMEAQYQVLREHGHSPSEAFNETVEELTQSLIRLVAQNGMDWMYGNCSTTAQRGALDWLPRFKAATLPVFKDLYESVATGEETRIVLEANSAPDYKAKLDEELRQMRESEMWQAGARVRSLRPENWNK
jgi:ketol-acid reductoisomerase